MGAVDLAFWQLLGCGKKSPIGILMAWPKPLRIRPFWKWIKTNKLIAGSELTRLNLK